MLLWLIDILLLPIVFYSLFSLIAIWLVWATEAEEGGSAFFAAIFISILGILKFGSFAAFFEYIKDNPLSIVLLIILYTVIGTVWSAFKWFLFVRDEAKTLNDEISKKGRQQVANDRQKGHWENPTISSKDILDSNFVLLSPKVKEHKEKITTWIMLWVPSVLWFLLNDPIRRLANWIYDRMQKAYQTISDNAFKIEQ